MVCVASNQIFLATSLATTLFPKPLHTTPSYEADLHVELPLGVLMFIYFFVVPAALIERLWFHVMIHSRISVSTCRTRTSTVSITNFYTLPTSKKRCFLALQFLAYRDLWPEPHCTTQLSLHAQRRDGFKDLLHDQNQQFRASIL